MTNKERQKVESARAELGTAIAQIIDKDDQIIAYHIRRAHLELDIALTGVEMESNELRPRKKSARAPKFIQIAACPNNLYAIDEDGQVWDLHWSPYIHWRPVSMVLE